MVFYFWYDNAGNLTPKRFAYTEDIFGNLSLQVSHSRLPSLYSWWFFFVWISSCRKCSCYLRQRFQVKSLRWIRFESCFLLVQYSEVRYYTARRYNRTSEGWHSSNHSEIKTLNVFSPSLSYISPLLKHRWSSGGWIKYSHAYIETNVCVFVFLLELLWRFVIMLRVCYFSRQWVCVIVSQPLCMNSTALTVHMLPAGCEGHCYPLHPQCHPLYRRHPGLVPALRSAGLQTAQWQQCGHHSLVSAGI